MSDTDPCPATILYGPVEVSCAGDLGHRGDHTREVEAVASNGDERPVDLTATITWSDRR